jgi:holin-like protein
MLFVPAGVGVIAYFDLLKAEAVPILVAVIGGTAVTLFVTAIVASRFGAIPAKSEEKSGELEGVTSDVST